MPTKVSGEFKVILILKTKPEKKGYTQERI